MYPHSARGSTATLSGKSSVKFPDAVNARVVTLDELKQKWHMSGDAYAALIKLQKEECKKRQVESSAA